MQRAKESQIGFRMDPEFREAIKAEANARFGGNESLLVREATRLYLQLRHELGVQFEPTIALWLRNRDDQDKAA